MNWEVDAISVSDSNIYAGGGFLSAGGVSAHYIAKWNGNTWSALGSGTNWDVLAIASSGGYVYTGGGFTTAGGKPSNYFGIYHDGPDGVVGCPTDRGLRSVFKLEQNKPNPFLHNTTIEYQVPKSGHVSIKVYNLTGQVVKTLVNDYVAAGVRTCRWNGKDDSGQKVAGGVYVYRLCNGNYTAINKLVLLR